MKKKKREVFRSLDEILDTFLPKDRLDKKPVISEPEEAGKLLGEELIASVKLQLTDKGASK